jgi:hypothetical protein
MAGTANGIVAIGTSSVSLEDVPCLPDKRSGPKLDERPLKATVRKWPMLKARLKTSRVRDAEKPCMNTAICSNWI